MFIGGDMTLQEIQESVAAEKRAQGLKANAKRAAENARRMQAHSDLSAERLQMQQSRERLSQQRRSTVGTKAKPRK